MTNQPWTGQDFQANDGLPIAPNKPFWYMHNPNSCWEFELHRKRWLWLPSFRTLFEIAGVNNVRMVPRGGTDSTMARVRMMDNGFQILDLEMGYQTRFPTKSGGFYYASVFDTPKVSGKRILWKHDREGYNEWREGLMNDGILEKPDMDILSHFMDMQEKRVQRHEGKHLTPRIKKMYEHDTMKLEYMKKYIETGGPVYIDGAEPPKKKGKRSV